MKVLIINGPNLDHIGTREPDIYGSKTFDQLLNELSEEFKGVEVELYQSAAEGELIDKLHNNNADAVLLNPGGLTHTSVSLADAVAATDTPVVEVHISYPGTREEFRKESLIRPHCKGTIEGLGMDSYKLAIEHLAAETA